MKSKVKSMLIIFCDIKGNVHKEFILAGQTVSSAYYCDVYGDCMKMCEDFTPNFGNKIIGCCITTTHCLTLPFSQGIFDQKHYCCLLPPYSPDLAPCDFSLFLQSEMKLKGRCFDTIEVIEAESQAVLGHDVENALKLWKSAGNGVFMRNGTT
jgi:hypothetical protein